MMSIKQKLTGKPSIDRPWMQYYPQEMIENLTVPNSTINAVEASVAAATVGIGIMLTLTVKTVNHARIFFIFLIVPPSHELMC